jgi:hypothetical protein
MYYDNDTTEKEFTPKKYCECVNNNGMGKSLTYYDDSRPPEEMCAYCGHVTWQQYIKRQVGNKLNKKYYR